MGKFLTVMSKVVRKIEIHDFHADLPNAMISQSFTFFKNKTDCFSINLTEVDLLDGYLLDFLHNALQEYEIDYIQGLLIDKPKRELLQ